MKKNVLLGTFLSFYLVGSYASYHIYKQQQSRPVTKDVARLLPTKVKEIKHGTTEKQLKDWVKTASQHHEKIAISGMQHSQGGQTYYPNAILLDMKQYNKIVDYKPRQKEITVQSGTTWNDIQQYIHKDGLALQVMQSQNIFTVGGSISVNVHGRDIRYGSLMDTVKSMRLLQADGSIIEISRTKHPELFSLVNGGYGLFGVILDVTLRLTDDEWYEDEIIRLDYRQYTAYFKNYVQHNPDVRMHMARISVSPNQLLTDMYVTNYRLSSQNTSTVKEPLKTEKIVALPKFMLGLSRYSDWGKDMLWETQKAYFLRQNGRLETRNNVMRSESDFMEYESVSRTEVLQEYFVPVDEFASYIDDLREVLATEKLNLLNITVRYVEKDNKAVMSYAKDDMFALVLLINQKKDHQGMADTQRVVRKMVDVTLQHQGSYYLPYYGYPSKKQLEEAYPHTTAFFNLKRKYDQNETFVNLFYKEYGK
ncbi:FAD-binding oxidoreductase [Priestia megaterium]|uniref:FAD-binding oxidoreductase n=1 Tax=Priestia megaterium TaxID=1404 RepID=UPI0020A09005|nr:FAD-binding oxidoreductase [Priestia megaterium]